MTEVLHAVGGTARRKNLSYCVGWRELGRAVEQGRIVRCGGAYALPDTSLPRQRAAHLQGVLSHTSAAEQLGLALPPGTDLPIHVTIPRKAARAHVPDDVRLRYRDLRATEVDGFLTTPLRTVVDCLLDEPLSVALAVGDSALRQALVDAERLAAAIMSRRGPGSARGRSRLTLLDARAANAFESVCRSILISAGITDFVPQVTVRHRGRWIGRIDLADRIRRIAIECDGFETHGGRDAFVRDLARHTALAAAGWRTLRFTWEQVMFHPAWVLQTVTDVIADADRALIAEQPTAGSPFRAA